MPELRTTVHYTRYTNNTANKRWVIEWVSTVAMSASWIVQLFDGLKNSLYYYNNKKRNAVQGKRSEGQQVGSLGDKCGEEIIKVINTIGKNIYSIQQYIFYVTIATIVKLQ